MRTLNPFHSILAERSAILSQISQTQTQLRDGKPTSSHPTGSDSDPYVSGTPQHRPGNEPAVKSTAEQLAEVTGRTQPASLPIVTDSYSVPKAKRRARDERTSTDRRENGSASGRRSTGSKESAVVGGEVGVAEKKVIRCGYPHYEECIASAGLETEKRRRKSSESKRERWKQILRVK